MVRLVNKCWSVALLGLLAVGTAHAEPVRPEHACVDAAHEAEEKYGLPAGLLLAIGEIESGRQTSEGRRPWPWSINAEGTDYISETMEGAIANVHTMQARGIRSIDTGCFQINMMFHPDAFPSLEAAFDPQANALYAARFLTELRGRTASWGEAVAAYHSATPWRGEAYRQLVWQAWLGVPAQPGMSAVAGRSVQVFVPSGAEPAVQSGSTDHISGTSTHSSGTGGSHRPGLPMVYTPRAAR